MRADRETLVAVAKRHTAEKENSDRASLEEDPVCELANLGLSFRAKDAARACYTRFFGSFQPGIPDFELLTQWRKRRQYSLCPRPRPEDGQPFPCAPFEDHH
jgi:hypothetical protein